MLRYIVTLFLFLHFHSASAQEEQIAWRHDFQLDWSNFQQRVGQGGIFKAFTYSGIRYEVRDIDGTVSIDVESYFLPDESWAFQDFLSAELLAHEELHFHITELYARKMRREFVKYEINIREFATQNLIEGLKKEYDFLYDEMEELQKRYDSETDHGINCQSQTDWNEWIDVQLKMTDSYSKVNPPSTNH